LNRRTAGRQKRSPQPPPGAHDAALEADRPELEREPPIAANPETLRFTDRLPHCGQTTSSISDELHTSSSNDLPHDWHANSYVGIPTRPP
jgi:hypothetical protein